MNYPNLISATINKDSIDKRGNRITTIKMVFPRFILAELNTHRMFNRNSASSRAIPFRKVVQSVRENPFIPIAWQKEHTGMQGYEYFTEEKEIKAKTNAWLAARDNAIQSAKFLNSNLVVHEIDGEDFISYNQFDEDSLEGLRAKERLKNTKVTKQLCNRLLEPFMYHTVLVTATEWDNFFELRCPQYDLEGIKYKSRKAWNIASNEKGGINYNEDATLHWLQMNKGQAEIHIMDLAEKVYDAMNESKPELLNEGEWHIPFRKDINLQKVLELVSKKEDISYENGVEIIENYLVRISTAMAARTSYTEIGEEKEVDYSKMIELHNRLITQDPPHLSPFEHCGRVMTDDEYFENVKGKRYKDGSDEDAPYRMEYGGLGWNRTFRGFIQYRDIVEQNNN